MGVARPSGSMTCLPVTRWKIGLRSVTNSLMDVPGRNETTWSGGIYVRSWRWLGTGSTRWAWAGGVAHTQARARSKVSVRIFMGSVG